MGWSVHRLNLIPNYGICPLEKLAQQVADYVDRVFAPDQKIDLVGFSMGGLVTRYYLQRLGGAERVQRYVSISAPNQGTVVAYALPLQGIVQMRPESEFIQNLNQDMDRSLQSLKVTTLWTPFDLLIIPPESSQMPVGKDVSIPVLLHPWMLKDRRCLDQVTQALREPV